MNLHNVVQLGKRVDNHMFERSCLPIRYILSELSVYELSSVVRSIGKSGIKAYSSPSLSLLISNIGTELLKRRNINLPTISVVASGLKESEFKDSEFLIDNLIQSHIIAKDIGSMQKVDLWTFCNILFLRTSLRVTSHSSELLKQAFRQLLSPGKVSMFLTPVDSILLVRAFVQSSFRNPAALTSLVEHGIRCENSDRPYTLGEISILVRCLGRLKYVDEKGQLMQWIESRLQNIASQRRIVQLSNNSAEVASSQMNHEPSLPSQVPSKSFGLHEIENSTEIILFEYKNSINSQNTISDSADKWLNDTIYKRKSAISKLKLHIPIRDVLDLLYGVTEIVEATISRKELEKNQTELLLSSFFNILFGKHSEQVQHDEDTQINEKEIISDRGLLMGLETGVKHLSATGIGAALTFTVVFRDTVSRMTTGTILKSNKELCLHLDRFTDIVKALEAHTIEMSQSFDAAHLAVLMCAWKKLASANQHARAANIMKEAYLESRKAHEHLRKVLLDGALREVSVSLSSTKHAAMILHGFSAADPGKTRQMGWAAAPNERLVMSVVSRLLVSGEETNLSIDHASGPEVVMLARSLGHLKTDKCFLTGGFNSIPSDPMALLKDEEYLDRSMHDDSVKSETDGEVNDVYVSNTVLSAIVKQLEQFLLDCHQGVNLKGTSPNSIMDKYESGCLIQLLGASCALEMTDTTVKICQLLKRRLVLNNNEQVALSHDEMNNPFSPSPLIKQDEEANIFPEVSKSNNLPSHKETKKRRVVYKDEYVITDDGFLGGTDTTASSPHDSPKSNLQGSKYNRNNDSLYSTAAKERTSNQQKDAYIFLLKSLKRIVNGNVNRGGKGGYRLDKESYQAVHRLFRMATLEGIHQVRIQSFKKKGFK